jgi:DNA-binding transcriptional regulator YiaG
MTSDQFNDMRRSLGLTVGGLAAILNTSKKSIIKWERGDYPPNPVACKCLEWFDDGFRPDGFEHLFRA